MIQSVAEIDERLRLLDSNVQRLADPEVLKQQLMPQIDVRQLGQLESEEQRINAELEQLQELWYVMTLQKEVAVNADLYEFETVFSSLDKLTSKVSQLSLQTEATRSKISQEVAKLQQVVVDKLIDCWKQLVIVRENSITFHDEVDIDGFPVLYEAIGLIVEQYSLPQTQFNLSNQVFDLLVKPLFQINHMLIFDKDTITATIISDAGSQTPLAILVRHIDSTRALVQFVRIIPANAKIIAYISPQLFDKLKELITEFAKDISESRELQQMFNDLGDFIQQHGFKRSDLKQWISSELYLLATEHSLNSHIEEIRSLFKNSDSFRLSKEIIKPEGKVETPIETAIAKSPETSDEWGWDNHDDDDVDKDAWDNEFDVDEDAWDNNDPKNDDPNEDWGWGDEEAGNTNDKPKPKPQKKLISKLNKKSKSPTPASISAPQPVESSALMITSLPKPLISIIQHYESEGNGLPAEYRQNHMAKVVYLLTTFYALATVKYPKALLLYNDIKFIDSLHKVPTLVELGDRYLMSFISKYENLIKSKYSDLNGLDPGLSSGFTFKVIQHIQDTLTTLFDDLTVLPTGIKTSVVLSIMDEFYQLVIDSIEARSDIGELESEYLSQIIQKFLSLEQPLGATISEYSKNHQKLVQLEFIMVNHMKEIMDKFYDGGLFELSTPDIVGMLDKLFADSDLKRSNIREIKEMRDEQY